MGFFQNIIGNIQEKIHERQQKQKEEQEFMRRLQLEAQAHQRITFEEEFRKNSKEVAIARAKKQAAEASGLQKLRAMNRARRLQEDGNEPGSFFDKMKDYTQKNLARRDENLKRTAEARDVAKQMREQKLSEQQKLREERMSNSKVKKPFGRNY